MKRIIFLVMIFLLIGTLSISVSCKPALLDENIRGEQENSLKPAAKVEQEQDETDEGSSFMSEDNEGLKTGDEGADIEQETEERSLEKDKEIDENKIDTKNEEKGSAVYVNDFTLLDIDGNKVSLSDFQGKIVVLNFWATWCPPCRAEIPDFIEVNNLYKDKGVQLIGISIDEDMDALKDFIKEFGINYPTLVDGTIDTISPIWGIRAIPTTFVLNEKGEVMFKNIGMMTKDQLSKVLDEILKL